MVSFQNNPEESMAQEFVKLVFSFILVGLTMMSAYDGKRCVLLMAW